MQLENSEGNMLELIDAIIQYLQAPSRKFDFLGSYTEGGTTEKGPFLQVTPEEVTNLGPTFPYMTFEIQAKARLQGYNRAGMDTMYAEQPAIIFHIYDTDSTRLPINMEKLTDDLDVAAPGDFGGIVNSLLQTNDPKFITEPTNKEGKRVYHGIVPYEFRVVRYKGTA
jgi:hypothetical protein